MSSIDSKFILSSINKSTKSVKSAFTKLASGKRINKASDDAAGLAIADALKSDAAVYQQASRNTSDGQSLAAIKEGALTQAGDIEIRKRELATQAANGTLSDEQRASLNQEYQALSQEQQRIVATTEFNGRNVFQGETSIEVDSGTQITIEGSELSFVDSPGDISTQAGALSAVDQSEGNIQSFAQQKGRIGAETARLEVAGRRAEDSAVENLAAESRIRDADVATEVANLTAGKILQQAGLAVQAQANQTATNVLNLLK